jgi:branched-chain amino acid transport system ATP-binding protein
MAAERIVRVGAAQVPEGRGIFPDLTVRENLLIGGYTRRDKAAVRRDYDAIMASFPVLAERAAQPGYTLSGGEQQMLAIGRALMSRPRLLLADEVSLGLAPVVTRRVFAELNRLKAEGMTLLVVEQNANLVMKSADYAHVLKHGRITLAGTRDTLAASGALAAAYLGA